MKVIGANVGSVCDDSEDEDANVTAEYVRAAGRKAVLIKGDIQEEAHCKHIIDTAVREFNGIDIPVNNAAFQMARKTMDEISSEEWDGTFRTNITAMFYLCKAAEPHLTSGSSIINIISVNAYSSSGQLLPCAATKGAIRNFTANLSQILLQEGRGIRVNAVALGSIWTPLIPSTIPDHEEFCNDTPFKEQDNPPALAYLFLASDDASYIAGATIPVTGGRITIYSEKL